MARMSRRRNRNNKTWYIVGFFCLVALMSSEFGGLGMTGIFFSLLFSIVLLVGTALVLRGIAHKTNEMLDGKPNVAEHLLAPGGYRRARYKESWDEYAAQSAVRDTPNRPLHVDPKKVIEAAPSRSVVKVAPQNLKRAQWLNACLELAHDFNPPHTHVVGRAILGIGQRGSGKSNVLALLLEQIWKLRIPGVVFDYKIDFASLTEVLPECRIGGPADWGDAEFYPGKYWEVTVENAEMIGYYIREKGAQLAIQLLAYPDMDTQGKVISGVIKGMFAWAKEHRSSSAPAIVALDEAQQYLPQSMADSRMSTPVQNEVLRQFKMINEVGRSPGLQPLLFTQRGARINKDAIGGTEIYILMRQTMPIDLKACEEILGQTIDRIQVAGFQAGDALIKENGDPFFCHFDLRQSSHLNKTPTVQDAVTRYQNIQVPGTLMLSPAKEDDLEEDEIDTEGLHEAQPTRPPVPSAKKQEDDLLERGLNAYLEGATTQPKLWAKLSISQWEARKLMPKIEAEIARLEASEQR